MSVDAVVIGAGGFGRETLDVIEAWNQANFYGTFSILGVIDDDPSPANLDRLARRGIAYLGRLDEFAAREVDPQSFRYFVGVGGPAVRALLVERCESLGWTAGKVTHPSASIGSQVHLGEGVVICGGAQVSTNVQLGCHVHLNPGAVIGHDTSIGDFSSVNPGAVVSGDVTVGERVLIGAGAIVLQQLNVRAGSTVGAGACVTREVPSDVKVTGIPARETPD